MKRVNLDPIRLIRLLVGNKLVSVQDIAAACKQAQTDPLPLTQHIGHARDEHGHLYSLFIANEYDDNGNRTDRIRKSKDGARFTFNVKSSNAPKRQDAATPGQVLPQGAAGMPNLSPQQLQVLQALVGAMGTQGDQAKSDEDAPFADFDTGVVSF